MSPVRLRPRPVVYSLLVSILAACGTPTAPDPAPSSASPASPTPPPGGPAPAAAFHATPTFSLGPAPEGPPRTVVIVSLDTVSAPHLALYGGPAETPALAAVAAQGRRYADAITHFPQTCLSHWTMMTGVLPLLHGNAPGHAGSRWTGPTLAELAQRAGMPTAAVIGGVTLQDRACGLARGFDRYDDQFALDPADMRRPAAEVTAAALEALAAFGDRPGLLFVHYFDAHFPYTPPSPWDRHYDPDYTGTLTGTDAALARWRDGAEPPPARERAHVEALYQGELSALDAAVAPLLAAVPEDAVLVITSDHGESFGHAPWFNHRGALWEDVLRVPLLIRAPGLAAGTVDETPVGLVDLAPTVARLAGLAADTRMQGRDLTGPVATTGLWSTTDPWLGPAQRSLRTGTAAPKLRFPATGPALAYDLVADPAEQAPTPAPAASAEALDALVAALEAHQAPAPAPRGISAEEAHQLEQLGYVAPGGTRPPAPGRPPARPDGRGKAPGRRHGPPQGATPPR